MINLALPPSVADIRQWTRIAQPFCLVFSNAAQTLSNITTTDVVFNSETSDRWGMHDTVTNNERITFAVSGLYLCGGNVRFDSNATGLREVRLNDSASIDIAIVQVGPSATFDAINLSRLWQFDAGDYLKMTAFQASGGNLDITTNNGLSPVMWCVRVGG